MKSCCEWKSRTDNDICGLDHSGRLSIQAKMKSLSTGCKTVLNVLYYPNKVFCLKECGNNALEILYHFESGHVFSEYALIPFIMDTIAVQSKSGKK